MPGEHPAIRAVAHETDAHIVWYDTAPCDGWFSREVTYGETSSFTLVGPRGRELRLSTSLLGEHNIENIVGVAAFLLERGLGREDDLVRAVASFQGIRRRLDRLTADADGETGEVIAVLSDQKSRVTAVAFSRDSFRLVMGSEGRTGIKRLLLGSVAEKVVRHAHCSVLVAREV